MTSEEIMKEVKLRYPIGTRVYSLKDEYKDVIMVIRGYEHITQWEEAFYIDGDISSDGRILNPMVYGKGKWARVAEQPIINNYEIY